MQRALEKHQLCLYYQPIIDIKQKNVSALKRCYVGPVSRGKNESGRVYSAGRKGGDDRTGNDYVIDNVFRDLGAYLATHNVAMFLLTCQLPIFIPHG